MWGAVHRADVIIVVIFGLSALEVNMGYLEW